MPLEMRFDSVQHGIALFLGKRPSKEFHHTSVSIHTGERLPVGVTPRAQGEALGGDSHLVHDTQIGLIVALISHVRNNARQPNYRHRAGMLRQIG
jgi:hypothetical protein